MSLSVARLVTHAWLLILLTFILTTVRAFECLRLRTTSSGLRFSFHQKNCYGYDDTITNDDSGLATLVHTETLDLPAYTGIVIPGDPTPTNGVYTKRGDTAAITSSPISFPTSTASPEPTLRLLLPRNVSTATQKMKRDLTDDDSNSDNISQQRRTTFAILVIALLITTIVAIVMANFIKQDRMRKRAAARTAEMEMAVMAAVEQEVYQPRGEQLPSYREAVASGVGGHRTKPSDGRSAPSYADNGNELSPVTAPVAAHVGHDIRQGDRIQPANNRMTIQNRYKLINFATNRHV